jgi:diamine N-acetyltransferase
MKPEFVLGNGKVILRPLRRADLDQTLAWRNRDDVRIWFFDAKPITPDQHNDWYEAYRQRRTDWAWIIVANGVPCGQVSLYNVNARQRGGEFGRMMIGDPRFRGNGVGRVACSLVCDFALRDVGLDFVYLRVLDNNLRAIQLYKDCGFHTTSIRQGIRYMERSTL